MSKFKKEEIAIVMGIKRQYEACIIREVHSDKYQSYNEVEFLDGKTARYWDCELKLASSAFKKINIPTKHEEKDQRLLDVLNNILIRFEDADEGNAHLYNEDIRDSIVALKKVLTKTE